MKLVIILALVSLSRARYVSESIEENSRERVCVRNVIHEKEVLKKGIDSPYQLAIDYNTNHLFFSYSTPEDLKDGFKSAYINLKTNSFDIISGINGGFSNAVDEKKGIVYLGGNDGLYTFDYNTKTATLLGAKDVSIWQLYFFKNNLYYSDYPTETAYYFENGVSKKVPVLEKTRAMLLAVDNNDNIFFSNASGLFCYKKEKDNIYSIGSYTVNGFTINSNNDIYVSTPEAIYLIEGNEKLHKLAEINNIYGVAIEADNTIIYSDDSSIVRLKPTKGKCSLDVGSK